MSDPISKTTTPEVTWEMVEAALDVQIPEWRQLPGWAAPLATGQKMKRAIEAALAVKEYAAARG